MAVAANAPVRSLTTLVGAAGIGGAVALALGAYANIHQPTGEGIFAFGFPAVLPMKAWFATIAALLGLFQLFSAFWMWGRLPGVGPAPATVAAAHRWLGTVAFLFTLPVAYHCLWALGFRDNDTRVLVHSILGCVFYGIFVTKMLTLRSRHLPAMALPLVGGLLFTVIVGLWLTSSLWFFQNFGFPGV